MTLISGFGHFLEMRAKLLRRIAARKIYRWNRDPKKSTERFPALRDAIIEQPLAEPHFPDRPIMCLEGHNGGFAIAGSIRKVLSLEPANNLPNRIVTLTKSVQRAEDRILRAFEPGVRIRES